MQTLKTIKMALILTLPCFMTLSAAAVSELESERELIETIYEAIEPSSVPWLNGTYKIVEINGAPRVLETAKIEKDSEILAMVVDTYTDPEGINVRVFEEGLLQKIFEKLDSEGFYYEKVGGGFSWFQTLRVFPKSVGFAFNLDNWESPAKLPEIMSEERLVLIGENHLAEDEVIIDYLERFYELGFRNLAVEIPKAQQRGLDRYLNNECQSICFDNDWDIILEKETKYLQLLRKAHAIGFNVKGVDCPNPEIYSSKLDLQREVSIAKNIIELLSFGRTIALFGNTHLLNAPTTSFRALLEGEGIPLSVVRVESVWAYALRLEDRGESGAEELYKIVAGIFAREDSFEESKMLSCRRLKDIYFLNPSLGYRVEYSRNCDWLIVVPLRESIRNNKSGVTSGLPSL
jgi:hypothetical protein